MAGRPKKDEGLGDEAIERVEGVTSLSDEQAGGGSVCSDRLGGDEIVGSADEVEPSVGGKGGLDQEVADMLVRLPVPEVARERIRRLVSEYNGSLDAADLASLPSGWSRREVDAMLVSVAMGGDLRSWARAHWKAYAAGVYANKVRAFYRWLLVTPEAERLLRTARVLGAQELLFQAVRISDETDTTKSIKRTWRTDKETGVKYLETEVVTEEDNIRQRDLRVRARILAARSVMPPPVKQVEVSTHMSLEALVLKAEAEMRKPETVGLDRVKADLAPPLDMDAGKLQVDKALWQAGQEISETRSARLLSERDGRKHD